MNAGQVQFFEVTAPGRFGRKQRQVLVVENDFAAGGGKVCMLNPKGDVRREVGAGDVLAVEKLLTVEGRLPEVKLTYLTLPSKPRSPMVEVTDTYGFEGDRLRDAFVGAIAQINPRVSVTNRQRGHSQVVSRESRSGTALGGTTSTGTSHSTAIGGAAGGLGADGASARPRSHPKSLLDAAASSPAIFSSRRRHNTVTGAPPSSASSSLLPLSSSSPSSHSPGQSSSFGGPVAASGAQTQPASGDGGVNSRVFGAGSAGGSVPAVRRAVGRRFFAMEENLYGFREPRVVALTEAGSLLQLFDASETIRDEYALHQLRDVLVHSVDDTAICLSFAVGDGVATVRKEVDLLFGTPAQRESFLSMLNAPAEDGATSGFVIRRSWADPLPRRPWHRFDVTKINKLTTTNLTLLISVESSIMLSVRAKEVERRSAGSSVVSSDVPIESSTGISPGQLQLERLRQPRRLRVSFASSQEGISARSSTAMVFEFASVADREHFIAVMNHLAIVPASMPSHLSTTPFSSVPFLEADKPPSLLWGTRWPSDRVGLFVASWNISSCPPPADMSGFLPPADIGYDLYAVGLQEIGSGSNRESWGTSITTYLNRTGARSSALGISVKEYTLVASESMWELAVWVWVRTTHLSDVTRIQTGYEATGLSLAKEFTGKQLGNKGAVGVSFMWRDVPVCFVNSHLAAKPHRVRNREADFRQIVDRLRLHPLTPEGGLDFVHQHEHVFWFGDLNYRIDLPFDEAVDLAEQRRWDDLLKHDQLLQEQAAGRVFVGFHEAKPAFIPSYRWDRTTATWSNKNGQAPSWTDRLFNKSLPGVKSRLIRTSCDTNNRQFGSDHRPVFATYDLLLRQRYTIAALPRRHPANPPPTFFTQEDSSSSLHTPIFMLHDLKLSGLNAFTSPDNMFLVCHSVLLEAPVSTPVTASSRPPVAETLLPPGPGVSGDAGDSGDVSAAGASGAGGLSSASSLTSPAAGSGQRRAALLSVAPRSVSEDNLDHDSPVCPSLERAGSKSGPRQSSALLETSLQSSFVWEDYIMTVVPVLWDPRLLYSHHLAIAAHGEPVGDGPDPVGQTSIPLAPVVKAAAAAVKRVVSERTEAGLPVDVVNADGEGVTDEPDWLLDSDGIPIVYKLEGVPFSVPVLASGQRLGTLSGKLVLRSAQDPAALTRESATLWDESVSSPALASSTPGSPSVYSPVFGGASGPTPPPLSLGASDVEHMRSKLLARLPPRASLVSYPDPVSSSFDGMAKPARTVPVSSLGRVPRLTVSPRKLSPRPSPGSAPAKTRAAKPVRPGAQAAPTGAGAPASAESAPA